MTTLTCKYLFYLPEGYSHSGPAWPMMLFLHGAGERGDDLEKVKMHGPPKLVEGRKDFPFIVISPQCPSDSWWPKEIEILKNLVDEICNTYSVDEERIYLTGLSMGGYGTWSLASEYPERFAAIAPICGGGEPFFGYKLRNVPVWAFHGAKDNLVPLEKSEQMVEAIKNAGGQAKLTVYPDAGHDSWTATYENEKLYEWFLKHKREKKK
jgi:predicted peptidase